MTFETFGLSAVRELLESDHVLALAALRIEIERKLRLLVHSLDLPIRNEWSISKLVDAMRKQELLSPEQVSALQKIVNMCNKAIHGSLISKTQAREIIDLADELNKSFSIGYSLDFSANPDYEEHGLVCEWEHCIEWMPLTEAPRDLSCPTFAHNCPGGVERVSECTRE